MKNVEKAAMPISAISKRAFVPRRLSAKPAQVCRTNPSKSVSAATGSLNQKTEPRESFFSLKIKPKAKMRIAAKALALTAIAAIGARLVGCRDGQNDQRNDLLDRRDIAGAPSA
jgi:hypothetical protein